MKKSHKIRKLFALGLCAALAVSATATAFAATNTPIGNSEDFSSWKTSVWDGKAQLDSGHIILTPGKTAAELNFAWYSEAKGKPAVKISEKADLSGAKAFSGTAEAITASNGTKTYAASNKVTATGLKEKTTYYYSYSSDGTTWSDAQPFDTQDTASLQMLYLGDPQIGSSSGDNGIDIVNDTYNWNYTLETATKKYPGLNFILSAGDQIDSSSATADSKIRREQEYAGFLYPQVLRNYPLATTIGNHETAVGDYSQHYNNPNSSNLGTTPSGSDYYFNYGKVLFIVLNSNNRNAAEHDRLISNAINDPASKDAQWKIVMFHHDIYGSGEPHSDVDGANLRALFAPLMDKYSIDVCLTGHDHSYARTYQVLDGKVIDYGKDKAVDPQGTLYLTANSASGSKFYTLNPTRQYYISERNQEEHPNYSVIDITDQNFTIKTYDVVDNGLVDQFSLEKTAPKQSLLSLIQEANDIKADKAYASTYTDDSRKALEDALKAANTLLTTDKDGVPEGLFGNYDKAVQGDNPKDKLNYYGYAATETGSVEAGYSAFLDKTKDNAQAALTTQQINEATAALNSAIDGLAKVSDNSSTPDSSTPGNNSSAPNSSSTPDDGVSSATNNPQTGDHTDTFVAVIFAGMILAAAAVLFFNMKKYRKNI